MLDKTRNIDIPTAFVLQLFLDYIGLYDGTIDGIWGKKSEWAIQQYGKIVSDGSQDPRKDEILKKEKRFTDVMGSVDPRISHGSFAMIAAFEGGGFQYYLKYLSKPSVPSATSGVTIGLGYDVHYQRDELEAYWAGILTPSQIARLKKVAPYVGKIAYGWLQTISDIRIDYMDAMRVLALNLSRYTTLTISTFDLGKDGKPLTRDQLGVLTSIVFNRGSSLSGERRKEMRDIKTHIAQGKLELVADDIRSMSRLWQNSSPGLVRRRAVEARLWEWSLNNGA